MTAVEQLNAYLRRMELRLRLFAASRGTALVAGLALVLTLFLVWIANRYQFASGVVLPLRILLFVAIAVAVSFGLALPLLRMNRRWVTRLAERRIPGFEERLLTATEKPDAANPFTELVAEDALRVAREQQVEDLTPSRSLLSFLASGIAAAAILIWLIAAGPGYWGYGASLLWTGQANPGKRPLYDINVQPGNKTIRRKSDQAIRAQLLGFSAQKVTLHARYGVAAKWEETTMQPKASGYEFLFAGVSDPVEYFVQADTMQSKHFKLAVKDLPGVKRVKVALHFPSGLGIRDVVQDPGGDLRAVEGSQADIAVLTDRPLEHGVLVLDNGTKVDLQRTDGNWSTAQLPIRKDGSYHVAAIDSGETIRISDDYFIEAKKDEPASVRIVRPGSDPHVSPIEELPITVEAADDFGVNGLELHYSVNGGAEKVVPLLKSRGTKDASGATTLYLENFKLVPGDIVSFYATAKDAKATSQTDIVFAQAEPFDFKFSQSQQAGGMGMGAGNQDNNISERQKQIIAATWNELRGNSQNRTAIEENSRFLADLEGKLSDQAKTLAERMASRELGTTNAQFENFSKLMTQASSEMGTAQEQLKPGKWHDALPPEQKALQSLLRAEALFRDIQVAFGQRSGGGGGGSGAQRDLARMFDLELDTSKNQYETGQSGASSQNDQQKAIDDAFERLQDLARRQQELAQQNQQHQAFEQRWQEEQLRREAEELRQQMEQLAKNSQGQGQQGQQGQQSQQQGSQGGQQGNSSGQSARSSQSSRGGQMAGGISRSSQQKQQDDALRQASSALQRAEDEMRKAVSDHDTTAQQRAAAQLAEAQRLLNNSLHQQAGSSVSDLSQKAQELANAQRDLANQLKRMYGQSGSRSTSPSGAEGELPEMNDPNSLGRGMGYRRRFWASEMPASHTPTEQEKAIADSKEKLAQQLEQLQKQMQQESRNLAAGQPDASSKMRKALSEAEQKELALRMEKNAEWIREGYGDRNIGMEDSVTNGLEQLSRDLHGVQNSINEDSAGGKNGQQEQEQRALEQLRGLREQLEQAQQQANGGRGGNRPGQQSAQSGQQPSKGGQQRGQSGQSGAQQSGQGGQPGQEARFGQYSPGGGSGAMIDRRGIQNAIGELNRLRGQIDPRDRALSGYVDGTLGYLRTLYADPNVLQSTISQDAVSSLERLEVELTRRVGDQQAKGARAGAPETSPDAYRNAVAEYFKRLSQPKQ